MAIASTLKIPDCNANVMVGPVVGIFGCVSGPHGLAALEAVLEPNTYLARRSSSLWMASLLNSSMARE